MKEKELRKHLTCSICHHKIGESTLPIFWTMTLTQHGIDLNAIRRQDGLAALLGGNSGLAQVMGPDEEMTQTLVGPVELTICQNCAMDIPEVMVAITISEERQDQEEQ